MSAPAPCPRCASPAERGDLRCAVCGEIFHQAEATPPARARTRFARCPSCSAAMAYDADAGAPRCAFCGATTKVEEVRDPMEQTEQWLPFRSSAEEARLALRGWLGRQGFFRPPDLRRAARVESLQPVYWVAWVFDARARVSWTADSDHDAGRSRWAPHAGQCRLEFEDVLVPASRGLSHEETRALAPSYDLDSAAPTPDAPEGVLQEQFDVQRSTARARILSALEAIARQRVARGEVPGTRFRNVHAEPLPEHLVTRRLAFPAWVLAWRYRGELFRTVVSGQDPSVVLGTAPWSPGRIAGAIALALVLIAALALALFRAA